METNLARELRKHYSFVGREVIFTNGLNQTALAEEMGHRLWLRGEKWSIYPSVLSSVIWSRGGRILTPVALDVFCEILELSERERWDLYTALFRDYCLRDEVNLVLSIPPYVVEQFSDDLETVKKVRRAGRADLAIERAGILAMRLRHITRDYPDSRECRPLREILANLIFQQAEANLEIVVPNADSRYTDLVYTEMNEIAHELDDPELYGLRLLHLGGFHYVRAEFEEAVPLFGEASEKLEEPDARIEALRGLGLSWANLAESEESAPEEFARAESETRELINQGNWKSRPRICGAVEGIGRGQGLLGREEAFETLLESEEMYYPLMNSREHEPLRGIQLAMSRLIVASDLAEKDYRLLEEEGRRAMDLAEIDGYVRYKDRIEILLMESLN